MDFLQIEKSWREALKDEFSKPYFVSLIDFLKSQKTEGKIIYPKECDIFKAFDLTPLNKVKVVILGQDPYHGEGQAMGLSFSVPNNMKTPPSLKNIFKELESDLNIKMSGSPDLTAWAEQGILLLNSILSVEAGKPASHSKIGWTKFTDEVISYISTNLEGVIFLLWGNYAKTKAGLIDKSKHYVLEAAHPSPLARGAFFGSKHFSLTNKILEKQSKTTINWQL